MLPTTPPQDFCKRPQPHPPTGARNLRPQLLRCSDAPSADNAIDINDGNGAIPACGNDLMMNRIYREQFLFSGFIVSDCDSIGEPSFEEYIGRRVSRSGPACDLR